MKSLEQIVHTSRRERSGIPKWEPQSPLQAKDSIVREDPEELFATKFVPVGNGYQLAESQYDPTDISGGQLEIADQLIADAAARGITLTYADLGLQVDVLDALLQESNTKVIHIQLPVGVMSDVVVQ